MAAHRVPGRIILPLLLVAMLSGCAENGNPADEGDAGNGVDLTDPLAVLAAHARSLEEKDLDTYAALLATDFEYVPREDVVDDFPWLSPDHPWTREDELLMIGNMMNPEFVSDQVGGSVDSIEMVLAPGAQRPIPGGVEVACNADILVLWAPRTGAQSLVRFQFELVADAEGHHRIRRIVELTDHGRRAAVEPHSWGSIKSMYR